MEQRSIGISELWLRLLAGSGRIFGFRQFPVSDSLLLNGTYGIKRAHFKQSNPHMYRHVRLGAAQSLICCGCRSGYMEAKPNKELDND